MQDRQLGRSPPGDLIVFKTAAKEKYFGIVAQFLLIGFDYPCLVHRMRINESSYFVDDNNINMFYTHMYVCVVLECILILTLRLASDTLSLMQSS